MAAIYHQGKLTQSRFLSLYKGNLITTKAFSGKSSRMKGHLQRKIKHTKYVNRSVISNSSWTEGSTIQRVIVQIAQEISKSDEREARGRFEITSTITP